ncbi:MAG: polyamine aminopropyltransferase [Armatimonadetes bacterium]|nr:polyamine aminopropyltransferase [Armatimonadota bacterium]
MHAWLTDQIAEGFAATFRIGDTLYDHRSPYQHIRVVTNAHFGRMLVLDDAVQTTERDEHYYHESLAHLALCAHPRPRRVLIIGGGDGGLLKEVLRHPVERVIMVEIDAEVIAISRRFLPAVCRGAFEDARAAVRIDDGIRFVAEAREAFDVILVDSPDPKGPALGLYSGDFYDGLRARLAPAGVLAVQSGSPLFQADLLRTIRALMASRWPVVRTALVTVPTYPGGLWSLTLATSGADPAAISAHVLGAQIAGMHLRYYSPALHHAAFEVAAAVVAEIEQGAPHARAGSTLP